MPYYRNQKLGRAESAYVIRKSVDPRKQARKTLKFLKKNATERALTEDEANMFMIVQSRIKRTIGIIDVIIIFAFLNIVMIMSGLGESRPISEVLEFYLRFEAVIIFISLIIASLINYNRRTANRFAKQLLDAFENGLYTAYSFPVSNLLCSTNTYLHSSYYIQSGDFVVKVEKAEYDAVMRNPNAVAIVFFRKRKPIIYFI